MHWLGILSFAVTAVHAWLSVCLLPHACRSLTLLMRNKTTLCFSFHPNRGSISLSSFLSFFVYRLSFLFPSVQVFCCFDEDVRYMNGCYSRYQTCSVHRKLKKLTPICLLKLIKQWMTDDVSALHFTVKFASTIQVSFARFHGITVLQSPLKMLQTLDPLVPSVLSCIYTKNI